MSPTAILQAMWRETARRIFVLVVVVVLAATFQVRSVQGFSAEAQMTAMNIDMPMPGKCDGCAGNEKTMAPSACSISCTMVAALPFLVVAYQPALSEAVEQSIGPAASGQTIPPDPYPPKPTRII